MAYTRVLPAYIRARATPQVVGDFRAVVRGVQLDHTGEFVRIAVGCEVVVRRVVLDDVSLIGTSYPFLKQSRTSGELFLPAFVHVMRNYEVDLLMTATTSELEDWRR